MQNHSVHAQDTCQQTPEQNKKEGLGVNYIDEIYRHIGDNRVLIPVPRNKKAPAFSGWQNLTVQQTKDPNFELQFFRKGANGQRLVYRTAKYREELCQGNIGVLLGAPSGGLCTIDIDLDEEVPVFLAANPKLKTALFTRRSRGGNVWLQVDGECPNVTPIKTKDGKHWGEFRGTGGQTMIYGAAIGKGESEAVDYRIITDGQPVVIRLEEINWPAHVQSPEFRTSTAGVRRGASETRALPQNIIPSSNGFLSAWIAEFLHSYIPASLHNTRDLGIAQRVELQNCVDKLLQDKLSPLAQVYERYIEPKFRGVLGGRNQFLVGAMPFLYRTVGWKVAVGLALIYYLKHSAIFHDPLEQHLKEAESMLLSVAETYLAELSKDEREVYCRLDCRQQDAFRICRDLALRNEPPEKSQPKKEPLTFFMSHQQLAARLGILPMQAFRLVEGFCGCGILRCVKKGLPHAPGFKSREAGHYKWELPQDCTNALPQKEAA